MSAASPIKLGSAAVSGWTFQTGSNSTTDEYGIQSLDISALFGDGSSVYNNIPSEGTSASALFSGYVPGDFKLDFFEGGPKVEYTDGTTAKATFRFKRIDPLFTNRRTVTTDTVLNYKSILTPYYAYAIGAAGVLGGADTEGIFGFPEPTANVKYSTNSQPGIGSGGLSAIYAQPGSSKAAGFPPVPDISVPLTSVFPAGAVLTYFNGTDYVSAGPLGARTTFTWSANFSGNPRGWQLTKLKSEPVAAQSFWKAEEDWRNFYILTGVTFVSATPPP